LEEPQPPSPTAFEDYPLTRSEYIAALVHFYRGELSRADHWRARLDPTTNWAIALDRPTFKISALEAIGIRLRYNYLWIYFAILAAWLAKLHIHPTQAASFSEVVDRMAIGPISGPVVLVGVLILYVGAVTLAIRSGHTRHAVDEVRGLETSGSWKT
jgi:uncharacterized membrane protein